MSPRWATVAGYGLYFYAEERHQRPHVDVRRGTAHATLDVQTGQVLAGSLTVLKAVRALLAAHRKEAVRAFEATRRHQFPGTRDASMEDPDDRS